MNATSPKARDIFLAAIKLPAAEWGPYLDQACGDDQELRRRLVDLLSAHRDAGSFLSPEAPAFAKTIDCPADKPPVAEGPGATIGPYKLLEQIGEGGFGVVFMAEQTHPVRRKVALKVLKPGMDTKQVIARFEAERQALAIMDHPNIARVFDGGATPSGRSYFVMELVKGVPITEYCDQNHLTPRQRLELFVPVCQAVQHAHQKGIIHRDLKPTNVLVVVHDTTPVVKVIDFGVAKALGQELTEKTLFTGFAQMIGTPLYMSPEQAGQSGLDIDTRSDIYSLGVMLYELLTGTTPFDRERFKNASYEEIRRIIREEEPARPSNRISTLEARGGSTICERRQSDPRRLRRLFHGELDWIVMKALEKDRNRRYETANGLALDIQRYLADEPVQACPPSAIYRFRKFARRNRTVLAVAGVLLFCIALVGGLGGWVIRDQAARQRQADDQIVATLTFAEPLLREGHPWNPALIAADQRVESELHGNTLGPAVRSRAEQFRQDVQMLDALDEVRLRQAESRDGELFDTAGTDARYAQAFSDYGLAIGELEAAEAAARVRNSAIRETLIAALDAWMQLRPAQDPDWLRAVASAADDNAWRRTFRGAALASNAEELKTLAGESEALDQPPSVLAWLGSVLADAGLTDDADAVLLHAQQRYPADFWINYKRANFLIFSNRSNPSAATAYVRAAVAIRPSSAEAHSLLGVALRLQGDLDGAIDAYQQAVRHDPKFTIGRLNLAEALVDRGEVERALAECDRWGLLLKSGSSHVSSAQSNFCAWLGRSYAQRCRSLSSAGRNDEAVRLAQEAVDTLSKVSREHCNFPAARDSLARFHHDLGNLQSERGQSTEALKNQTRAVAIWGELANDVPGEPAYRGHRAFALTYTLAPLLAAGGRVAEAEAAYRQAIADWEKLPDVDPYRNRVWNAVEALSNLLVNAGRLEEAEQTWTKTLEIWPDHSAALRHRGEFLILLGLLKEGAADLARAFELEEPGYSFEFLKHALLRVCVADSPGYRDACRRMVARFADLKEFDAVHELAGVLVFSPESGVEPSRTVALAERAVAHNKRIQRVSYLPMCNAYLGMAHHRAGQFEGARSALEESLSIDPKNCNLPLAYSALAMTLRRLGNAEEAMAALGKAQSARDGRVEAMLAGGLGHWPGGWWEVVQGELLYNEAYALIHGSPAPEDPRLAVRRGRGLGAIGRVDEAIAEYHKAVELNTKYAPAHCNLGRALYTQGKTDEAIAEFGIAIELDPKDVTSQNDLAWLLATCPDAALRDPLRAVEIATKAVELRPMEGTFRNTLGVALYRAGDWHAAIEALDKSLELRQGGDAFDWYFLAMAEWQRGNKDDARKWYEKARDWTEKNAPANEELQRFEAQAKDLLDAKKLEDRG
jgi:serine/threonine protein kinase/tetratricopeptide (TPR) repeat protein